MTEGRQETLTRKEPITVWVPSLDANVEVLPLPWRKRNDLGNLINTEFRAAIGKSEEAQSADIFSFMNYDVFLEIQFPGRDFSEITSEELMPLLHFMCEVNGLESVLWMLDPEAEGPTNSPTEGPTEDGERTSSTDDSSPVESPPTFLKN